MKCRSLIVISVALVFADSMVVKCQLKYSPRVVKEENTLPICRQQGFTMKLWMANNGVLGCNDFRNDGSPNLEYPVGSGIQHLYAAGPMIGAIVEGRRKVSRAYRSLDGGGDFTGVDSFFSSDVNAIGGRRNYDDDHDGKIDEDELDGIDNDGDGKIDEDYGAVSEHDLYCGYTDTSRRYPVQNNVPLGIKVWQRSFAWGERIKEPILPIEYNFVNIGRKVLKDVYLGFFADFDVGPFGVANFWEHNFVCSFETTRTMYVHNPVDRGSTPIGLTVLHTPRPLDSLRFFFHWFDLTSRFDSASPGSSDNDSVLYTFMSGEAFPTEYSPCQPPTSPSDVRFLFSLGPFSQMMPGDTLKFVIALVSGDYVRVGPNNLFNNAVTALELYQRDYNYPPVPPSPPLRISKGKKEVVLDWKWRAGDAGVDPEENWDDYNQLLDGLPDTSWRKRNPPAGKVRGGRNLEGFRVWRSEDPSGDPQTYTLLAQYNTGDDPVYGYHSGLKYTYVDSIVRRGNGYWYAVTSYSVPEGIITTRIDPSGNRMKDTTFTKTFESSLNQNATKVQMTFGPSTTVGEVKVVPNPYRADVYYTDQNGFEGPERTWTDAERTIWFIDLPQRATIRVFSLAGDIITTIEHEDSYRSSIGKPAGQEEWKLFSESGRPLASGVYIFSVESQYGKQIGKFVVMK